MYECLLLEPNQNSHGVKVDLSLAKKVWFGSLLLKKAVGDNSKKLKDKIERVIIDMLVIKKLNNIDEMMNLYDYAVFFSQIMKTNKKYSEYLKQVLEKDCLLSWDLFLKIKIP